jgi:hypothetical protein
VVPAARHAGADVQRPDVGSHIPPQHSELTVQDEPAALQAPPPPVPVPPVV